MKPHYNHIELAAKYPLMMKMVAKMHFADEALEFIIKLDDDKLTKKQKMLKDYFVKMHKEIENGTYGPNWLSIGYVWVTVTSAVGEYAELIKRRAQEVYGEGKQ